MCSRGGLQAAPWLLIIDFEGEVCDFGPLAAPNRIAKIVFVIGRPAPNFTSNSATSHYTGCEF